MQEVVYFAVNIIPLDEYMVLISRRMFLSSFKFQKKIWLPEFLYFLQSEGTLSEDTNKYFE